MNRVRTVLAVSLAALAAGCTQQSPELTLYADGQSVEVPASRYCDVLVSHCQAPAKSQVTMPIRPGRPAQVAIPGDVADTPWLITVQSVDAGGKPEAPVQKLFKPGDDRLAYTARPRTATGRLTVIEIDQISGALVQTQGRSTPDVLARGVWVAKFSPGS